MMYIAVCVIGKDICVVEGRIVSPFRLQCCRMVVTIYRGLTKLFPPTWQHHHLTVASTIVPISQHCMSLIPTVKQHGNGKANLRLDASLLQRTLRSPKDLTLIVDTSQINSLFGWLGPYLRTSATFQATSLRTRHSGRINWTVCHRMSPLLDTPAL